MRQTITLSEDKFIGMVSKMVKACLNESFRGERGLANLGQNSELYLALQNAKTMRQNNEDPLKIKQTTGWEIGYDGNWKYEGVDGTIKQTPFEQINTLQDIWDDEDLYKWYPELRNVKIVWKNGSNDGYAYSSGGSITLPQEIIWWDNRFKRNLPLDFVKRSAEMTLQHEIQHEIQHLELWSNGRPCPNPQTHENIRNKILKNIEMAKKYIGISKEECFELYSKSPKNSPERTLFFELYDYIAHGYTVEDFIKGEEEILKKHGTFEEREQEYYNSSGEKEAYEVNNRYGWDYNKRRNTLMNK